MAKRKQKKKSLKSLLIILVLLIVALALLNLYEKYFPYEQEENPVLVESADITSYIGKGAELAYPVEGHQIIEHTGYTLSFNSDYLVADWVCYEFTHEEYEAKLAQRKDSFKADPMIEGRGPQLSDYKNSGYSRGHLAPAADFNWSEEAMDGTFYLSNMTPQKQNNFNAGIWLKAEDFVRELCSVNSVVFVATGPVLTDGPYETIGDNGVAVPKNFYKALIAVSDDGSWSAYGLLIPHDAQRKDSLDDYLCSIDHLEEVTGLDFFYILEDSLEDAIEAFVPTTVSL